MSDQGKYTWLMVLAQLWEADHQEDDPDGQRYRMACTEARAGTLHEPQTDSANDLALALFIWGLVSWWNSAKYVATLAVFWLFLCKFAAARKTAPPPGNPRRSEVSADQAARALWLQLPCTRT